MGDDGGLLCRMALSIVFASALFAHVRSSSCVRLAASSSFENEEVLLTKRGHGRRRIWLRALMVLPNRGSLQSILGLIK